MRKRRIIRSYFRHKIKTTFGIAFGIWGTVGVIIGSISIFNLTIRLFDLGIAVVIKDLLNAYIWVFHDVILGVIWSVFSITAPSWFNDTLVIWGAFTGTSIRTLFAARNCVEIFKHFRQGGTPKLGSVEKYLFSLPIRDFRVAVTFISILFWPVLCLRYIYASEIRVSLPYCSRTMSIALSIPHQTISYRQIFFLQALTITVIVILLIITNAGLPVPTT